MSLNRELLGVCGLYCGACYHYRASTPGGDHLLAAAVRRGWQAEGFGCRGCRSDRLYLHPGCQACQIRACAEEKGVLHCGQCGEFPCQTLRVFQNDGRIHHLEIVGNLRELRTWGPERWLAEQATRWTCECGNAFSWYESVCTRCGAQLDSHGSDPRSGLGS